MITKDQINSAEAERALAETAKHNATYWVILTFGVLLAGFVRGVGVYSFIIPNKFAPGGITGVATIIEYICGISSGYMLAVINAPLIIIAFIFIGKRFAIISGLAILLSSAFILLFEYVQFPRFQVENSYRMLAAIAGGLISGVGIATMLKLGGSNGGTDIIATLIQRRYSATNIAWFIFMLDSTVVISSIFVYNDSLVPALLSFVQMFASSKVTELILQGFKAALKFEIITNYPDEVSHEIMTKLHRGVTMITAKGMYTGEEHAMLICILRRSQLTHLREILKKFPDTFAYISGTSEVVGRGFGSKYV